MCMCVCVCVIERARKIGKKIMKRMTKRSFDRVQIKQIHNSAGPIPADGGRMLRILQPTIKPQRSLFSLSLLSAPLLQFLSRQKCKNIPQESPSHPSVVWYHRGGGQRFLFFVRFAAYHFPCPTFSYATVIATPWPGKGRE